MKIFILPNRMEHLWKQSILKSIILDIYQLFQSINFDFLIQFYKRQQYFSIIINRYFIFKILVSIRYKKEEQETKIIEIPRQFAPCILNTQ